MPAIRFEGVSKIYRAGFPRRVRVPALQNLDLEVPPGVALGFIGPNGAGKSTAIAILLGLLKPTRGEARIFGWSPDDRRSREPVGFLPENPVFPAHLSGAQVLRLHGQLLGIVDGGFAHRVGESLDKMGLSGAAHQAVGTYSKGMVQRLGLAVALLSNPRLLVLDEPMTGLDPVGRREIRGLLSELHKQGVTLFFSTHILGDVERICDHIAVLDRGRLLMSGPLSGFVRGFRPSMEVMLAPIAPALRRKLQKAVGGTMEEAGDGILWTLENPPELEVILKRLARERVHARSIQSRSGGLEEVLMARFPEVPKRSR